MPEKITSEAWLELGPVGAALLIVLVLVILMFTQQAKSVDKLCTKIDALVTSFAATNQTLNSVIVANDKDQKEVLRKLDDIALMVADVQKRVVRIDVRLYNQALAEHGYAPEHINEDPPK